jgi:hypothetical protein
MGLVVFAVMGLYLLISLGVVKGAIAYAREKGKSARRWGWGAALVMWLIPFWDWIPTMVMHQYYCATEAGFWVYKTPEQWKQENPGVMETLVAFNDGRSSHGAYMLNPRFNWAIKKDGPQWFNRWRWEQEIVDTKTNDVLARYVDFSTGSGSIGGPPQLLKFWLQNDHCGTGEYNQGMMYSFKSSIRGSKK